MEHEIVDAPDAVALDPATMRGDGALPPRQLPLPGRRAAPRLAVEADETAEAEAERRDRGAAIAGVLPFGLEDIDFEASRASWSRWSAHRASGKTTTTYLLPRLYDVDDGAVEIDGIDIRKMTPRVARAAPSAS